MPVKHVTLQVHPLAMQLAKVFLYVATAFWIPVSPVMEPLQAALLIPQTARQLAESERPKTVPAVLMELSSRRMASNALLPTERPVMQVDKLLLRLLCPSAAMGSWRPARPVRERRAA